MIEELMICGGKRCEGTKSRVTSSWRVLQMGVEGAGGCTNDVGRESPFVLDQVDLLFL